MTGYFDFHYTILARTSTAWRRRIRQLTRVVAEINATGAQFTAHTPEGGFRTRNCSKRDNSRDRDAETTHIPCHAGYANTMVRQELSRPPQKIDFSCGGGAVSYHAANTGV